MPLSFTHSASLDGLTNTYTCVMIFFFGKPVTKTDYCNGDGYGQNIFYGRELPHCHYGCLFEWVGDGTCHVACNISTCNFDGGDCRLNNLNISEEQSLATSPSDKNFAHLSGIYNLKYGLKKRRGFLHTPLLFDKLIFDEFLETFKELVTCTTAQKFRTVEDTEMCFVYFNFLIEELAIMKQKGQEGTDRYQIYSYNELYAENVDYDFLLLEKDVDKMKSEFDDKQQFGKLACLNDATEGIVADKSERLMVTVKDFLERLFPIKSIFEK